MLKTAPISVVYLSAKIQKIFQKANFLKKISIFVPLIITILYFNL